MKLGHRTTAGRTKVVTCRAAVEHQNDLIADIRAYLARCAPSRALIEIGDQTVAVHFKQASEAAAFAVAWAYWTAADWMPGQAPSTRAPTLLEAQKIKERTDDDPSF